MPSATARSAVSWMPTSRWRCGTRACRRAPWSFEHAFLADAQTRARAVRLGVGVTVQHPLLYPLGGNLVRYWGPDRASQVMPVRAWVDEGALIAAGSDCNVSFFDPLLSIWGLVTRGTRTVGVQSPEHRVDTTRPSGSTPRQAAACSARTARKGGRYTSRNGSGLTQIRRRQPGQTGQQSRQRAWRSSTRGAPKLRRVPL